MATKPTTLPRWATDAGADKDAPSEGRKDSGFTPGAPDRDEMNWLFNANYNWADFVNKNFDTNGKLTLDSANGTIAPVTDNADVHVVRHDHASTGYAILQTDALRLYGAPRDATRRAQAPLDSSLYIQNAPKVLLQASWNGSAWVVDQSFNTSGGFVDQDADSYGIAIQDFSNILGVVVATIDGPLDLDGLANIAHSYWVRASFDPSGALIILPRWLDAGTWKNFRLAAPLATVRLNVVLW